jgi:hypothetical protein
MPKDDDSSDDDSEDSGPGSLGLFLAHQEKKKDLSDLTQFDGFEEGDEGTVVNKMKTIMALRMSLGMDKDVAFMEEQRIKQEERRRLEAMSPEERMRHEEEKAGDVLASIKAKRDLKLKEEEAKKKEEGTYIF